MKADRTKTDQNENQNKDQNQDMLRANYTKMNRHQNKDRPNGGRSK